MFNCIYHQLSSQLTKPTTRLAHTRQRWIQKLADRHIIIADDAYIIGDAQICLAHGSIGAPCHPVCVAKKRANLWVARQQFMGGSVACLKRPFLALDNELGGQIQLILCQRPSGPIDPIGCWGPVVGTNDLPDGSMPYKYVSTFAGDHPKLDDLKAEVRRALR